MKTYSSGLLRGAKLARSWASNYEPFVPDLGSVENAMANLADDLEREARTAASQQELLLGGLYLTSHDPSEAHNFIVAVSLLSVRLHSEMRTGIPGSEICHALCEQWHSMHEWLPAGLYCQIRYSLDLLEKSNREPIRGKAT